MRDTPALYAGYGCAITCRGRLPHTLTLASCEHPERDGHKFCPECGTQVNDDVRTTWDRALAERTRARIAALLPEGYAALRIDDVILILRSAPTPCADPAITAVALTQRDETLMIIAPILHDLALTDLAAWGPYAAVATAD